jgi:hypothetical protein
VHVCVLERISYSSSMVFGQQGEGNIVRLGVTSQREDCCEIMPWPIDKGVQLPITCHHTNLYAHLLQCPDREPGRRFRGVRQWNSQNRKSVVRSTPRTVTCKIRLGLRNCGFPRGAENTTQDWDLRAIEFSRRKTNGWMSHDEDLRNDHAREWKDPSREKSM